MIQEIWKDIKEYEGLYQVSNTGKVKSLDKYVNGRNSKRLVKGKLLSLFDDKDGYKLVNLYNNKKIKQFRVHILVAQAFIPNPDNLPFVNHKDMNKQNNNINNLEWCTQSYNVKHAIKNGANTMNGFNRHNKNKAHKKYGFIYQFDKSMNFIAKHYSPLEASKTTGVCARNILQVINHEQGRKQAGGYIWLKESEVIKDGVKI